MVKETNKYILIRPDAFLFCFGIDLPISFIPLYAEDLYQPILGITKETIMSMPISVSMFFTTLAFLIGGFWVDKKGWQHAHWFGVFFAGIGQIFSGIASSALQFIFYRAVYGFGYGLVFLSYMGFVYSNTDERNRTMGFASMSAGMYSGSICGGAIGGMLAERIGFQNVFFVSAFFILATLLYTTIFMKETYHHPKPSQAAATLSSLKSDLKLIARFLFDRNVFALLFLLSIPAAITLVGVLYYISPIYLDRLGTSQANIARILMINGVFMIYISPLLSPIMDKARDKRMFLVASGLIGGCGMFVCFFFLKGLSAIIFAILICKLCRINWTFNENGLCITTADRR